MDECFMKGLLFNIQRFSLHDGPGIRTTVFLKGCNLRCFWCHNPESISREPQLLFYPSSCTGCGNCFRNCPVGAHRMTNGIHTLDRTLCTGCGTCVASCHSEALLMAGRRASVTEVMAEVERDACFYQKSHGGVTFSGGEPMLQIDFLTMLLESSKKAGISTAVDTAGNVPWDFFEQILPFTDLFLFDMKAMDLQTHKAATGCDNSRILFNLYMLGKTDCEIWLRIPVIPGVNDNMAEMTAVASEITGLDAVKRVCLMPWHSFGSEKYSGLGMDYPADGYQRPEDGLLQDFVKMFTDRGFATVVG